MILFLDDERSLFQVCGVRFREESGLPPFTNLQKEILTKNLHRNGDDDVVTVRTYDEAVHYIENNPMPEMIFFDNDLGTPSGEPEGRHFLRWLLERNPPKFEAYFHTANRIARQAMQDMYNSYSQMFWN